MGKGPFIQFFQGILMNNKSKFSNRARKAIRPVISFFFGSLVGVSIDLMVFQSATLFGLTVFISNLISSSLAVITTYLLVTRYTFKVAASSVGFALFTGWYVCSITAFSILISYAVDNSTLPVIVCKLLSLPFSFIVNFLFSRLILAKGTL